MSFIREIKEKRQTPFWQIILMIFLSVLIINNLITLTNKIEEYTGLDANISSILVLFLSLALCAFVILKILSNYAYSLSDDSLIFERIIGKKVDLLLKLNISEILFVMPYTKMKKDAGIAHVYKFVYKNDQNHVYYGEFYRNEKKYRFIFHPSERMIRILQSKVNEKNGIN